MDIAVDIPEGHFGLIKPRSGLALKHQISVDAGVIDRDYRGNVQILVVNRGSERFEINKGDRIAQLILVKNITPPVEEVEELEETFRGTDGFGSTGSNLLSAGVLSIEQLETIDVNPSLTPEQMDAGKQLIWDF
jgi:deoxyuridine 5'-triphosphate nucleotidohydrolase